MVYLKNLKELTINGIKLMELYINNILVWKSGIKNWVRYAIDTDGSLYENTGYIDMYRLNSSGGLTTQKHTFTTGFIPCNPIDVIRMARAEWLLSGQELSGYNHISFYNKSFGLLGSINIEFYTGNKTTRGIVTGATSITVSNNVTTFNPVFSDSSEVAYFRISGYGLGGIAIVTVNEEIPNKFGYKNVKPFSTESDGKTIYNGGLGYKNGYRIRSGGAEAEVFNASHTGFIPTKGGDVIGIGGITLGTVTNSNAINVSDSTFTNIGQVTENYANAGYGIFAEGASYQAYAWSSGIEKNGCFYWAVPPDAGISYVRVTGRTEGNGANLIVTINEEIEL